MLLFCLKSVPWTNNELAGDDEENCENSQLTLKNPLISCNFVSVSLETLLKSCPITMSTLLSWKYGSAIRRRTAWMKRRFRRRVTDGFSLAVFRSRLWWKTPVTACLVCCVCFFFFYGEIYVEYGYGFVCFWSHNILFHRTKCCEGSPRSVL